MLEKDLLGPRGWSEGSPNMLLGMAETLYCGHRTFAARFQTGDLCGRFHEYPRHNANARRFLAFSHSIRPQSMRTSSDDRPIRTYGAGPPI